MQILPWAVPTPIDHLLIPDRRQATCLRFHTGGEQRINRRCGPRLTIYSFVSSKPFLVFGPQRTLFYSHGNLLAETSPVLNKDVNGGMQEKHLETIEIKDVDGDIDDDTVMRFIQYAYSGDYTVPDPDIVQLSTDSNELKEAFMTRTSAAPEDESSVYHVSKKGKKKKKKHSFAWNTEPIEAEPVEADPVEAESVEAILSSPQASSPIEQAEEDKQHMQWVPGPSSRAIDSNREQLWNDFCSEARIVQPQPWRPRAHNDEREDYTSILLCHARLYKFSDRYDCEKLMRLALQKLRLTLSEYIFHQQRASDVVALIQYTYAHTMDFDHGQDSLRTLVLDFTVCYFRELLEHTPFIKLLQEGGSLPTDLMGRVAGMVS